MKERERRFFTFGTAIRVSDGAKGRMRNILEVARGHYAFEQEEDGVSVIRTSVFGNPVKAAAQSFLGFLGKAAGLTVRAESCIGGGVLTVSNPLRARVAAYVLRDKDSNVVGLKLRCLDETEGVVGREEE